MRTIVPRLFTLRRSAIRRSAIRKSAFGTRLFIGVLALAATVSLTGCASVPESREMQRMRVQEGFGRKYEAGDDDEFRVAPRDGIVIQSLNYTELNLQQQIGPDGRITVPLIGSVHIGGLTSREIEELLTNLLSEYMKKLDIVVLVNVKASKRIFVLTPKTGRTVALTGDQTVFDLIMSSTLPQFSDTTRIKILRADPVAPEVFYYNHYAMVHRGDSSTNIQLRADDIVSIPYTTVGVVFDAFDKVLIPFKLFGAAMSTIVRGLLIPAQFRGLDEVAERIEQGQNVGGRNGSVFF